MTGNDVFAELRGELDKLYHERGAQVVEVCVRNGRDYVGRRSSEFIGPVLHAYNGWASRLAGEPPEVIAAAIGARVALVREALNNKRGGLI